MTKFPNLKSIVKKLKWIGVTIAATAALATGKASEPSTQPNIIFFIVDDQRREFFTFLPDVSLSTNVPASVTPNLDRLAQSGVVLSELHVPAPVCIPSRFTMMTGYYPSRAINSSFLETSSKMGIPWVGQNTKVNSETTTIAHRLKALGYYTGAVGKNHVIEVPGHKKIASKADIKNPKIARLLKKNAQNERKAWLQAGFDYVASIYNNNVTANGPKVLNPHNIDWITDGALKFLDRADDKPFFLYFAATTSHGPRGDWETGDRLATPEGMLPEALNVLPPKESIEDRLKKSGYRPKIKKYWQVAGDNMWTDDALGALIDKLEQQGKLDNTIIVYFNDHGVESGKTTLYQGGMRSFAVISGPDKHIKGSRVVDSLTSSVDIPTTAMRWSGDPITSNKLDGIDLSPILTGRKLSARESVYGEMGMTRAVRMGDWKYIAVRQPPYFDALGQAERQQLIDDAKERMLFLGRNPFPNTADQPFPHIGGIPGGWDNTWAAMRDHPHYFDKDQLYHLNEDPKEKHNLANDPKHAGRLKKLKKELHHYLSLLSDNPALRCRPFQLN